METRRYNIITDSYELEYETPVTATLESFDTVKEAREAYKFIRENGYHIDCNGKKHYFNTKVDFSIDCEIFKGGGQAGFKNVIHSSFSLEKFMVKVEEILVRNIPISASSEEEALILVQDRYREEDIVLDYKDFVSVDIENINLQGGK